MSEYEKEFKFHLGQVEMAARGALHSGNPIPEGVIMKC